MSRNKSINILIGIIVSAMTAIVLITGSVHANGNASFIPLNLQQFDYHVGDSFNPDNIHPPLPSDIWNPVSTFKFSQLKGSHALWLRTGLPYGQFEDAAILLTAFVTGFDVYQDNDRIYSYGTDTLKHDPDFKYHMSHLIPLDPIKQGMNLYLRIVYPDRAGIGELISLIMGSTPDIMDIMIVERDDLYRKSIIDVCLGFLLGITGAISLLIFFVRFHERNYPFLSFGAFSLFVGATYLSDFNSLFFLNLSPETLYYLKSVSFLLVPVGLFAFADHMFNTRYRIVIRSIWLFHLMFAILSVFLIKHSIGYTYPILAILILNCSLCIGIILKSETETDRLIRISFIVFFVLFIILLIIHILELLNMVPATYDMFGWGMLMFVFVLGYFLVQHYAKTFQTMQTVSLELEKNKSELLELQKENLISQLEALKNQLNPHFLFNNFSTLSSIIEEDKAMAVDFVQELSRVYRYVLQTRIQTLVTLKEEIDFIESYKFLMSKRFGENLIVNLMISAEFYRYLIMPFSLQLLVENAIKHNIVSQKKPLTIGISIADGWLLVTNRLQKKFQSVKSTHIGLENIRNRYRLVTDKEIRIHETDSEFTVQIPLIEYKGERE